MKKPFPISKLLVHFIGIGGIGISALAQWFLAQNWAVSGSDISESDLIRDLRKRGLKVKIGHKGANIRPGMSLVVYNQAIPASNPELRAARNLRIPALSYPEVLGFLTREHKTLAVSGAHGKSTTTALLSLVFMKAGFDPTVIVGTRLREFGRGEGSNFRRGKSDYLIIEADEFKRSFHNYSPFAAIITNIDKEHLDIYKNLENVKKSFLKFVGSIKSGGILVANRDDKNLFGLKSKIQKIAKQNKSEVLWYSESEWATSKIKKFLKIPGRHNLSNAIAVFAFARAFGIGEKTILRALGSYRGAWRRMEYRGKFQIPKSKFQIPVYDDYAHHPTEIKATLQALREKFPKRSLICVFQPHQAHRTKNLSKEFVSAFDLADHLILLPIYRVAGRDKIHRGYASADLAEKIEKRGKTKVLYLNNPKRTKETLQLITRDLSPVVIMMGAGDIVNYTNSLVNPGK